MKIIFFYVIFIVTSLGDPRATVTRVSDNCNFRGISPGLYNYDFKKSIKLVKKLKDNFSEDSTIRQATDKNEDLKLAKVKSIYLDTTMLE